MKTKDVYTLHETDRDAKSHADMKLKTLWPVSIRGYDEGGFQLTQINVARDRSMSCIGDIKEVRRLLRFLRIPFKRGKDCAFCIK